MYFLILIHDYDYVIDLYVHVADDDVFAFVLYIIQQNEILLLIILLNHFAVDMIFFYYYAVKYKIKIKKKKTLIGIQL